MIQLKPEEGGEAGLTDLAPDLTPMLDILFILLVFFMLTAGSVFQSLDLTLPEDVTDSVPPLDAPKYIMLEIKKEIYRVDKKEFSYFSKMKNEIKSRLLSEPDYEVVIAGDQQVSVARFLGVLTYLQSQNIKTANILMTKGQDK